MTSLKHISLSLLGSRPVSSLCLSFFKAKPLVILYHGVTDRVNFPGIENYRGKHVNKESFRKQLLYLSKHFTMVPLNGIEKLVLEKKRTSKPLCSITFDDGYKNNFSNAFPILKELGIPATVFVTTGFLDGEEPLWTDRLEYIIGTTTKPSIRMTFSSKVLAWDLETKSARMKADNDIRQRLKQLHVVDRTRLLDRLGEDAGCDLKHARLGSPDYEALNWDEAAKMTQGGIAFGAHTLTHPILSTLSLEEQMREISLSRERVRSKIGHCEHFAYPNGQTGDWNGDTKVALLRAGFKTAWTTLPGRVNTKRSPDPFTLSRITLDESGIAGRFESLASNALPLAKFFLR